MGLPLNIFITARPYGLDKLAIIKRCRIFFWTKKNDTAFARRPSLDSRNLENRPRQASAPALSCTLDFGVQNGCLGRTLASRPV
jgi:hypothetical protein